MGGDAGIRVEVVDRQRALRVNAAWLTRVARRALERQGVAEAEITLLLVGDRRMSRLHAEWLGVPGPTDVITFDLGAGAGGLCGDIVVSTETACRAARQHGWAPRLEVAYYVVHGLLHLAGHDDLDPVRRRAMRVRERVLMAAAGLPHPPRSRRRRTPA